MKGTVATFVDVDRLDVAILRSLYGPSDSGPTGIPTAWSIARRLGAHGATVKRRLARLRADGVLASVRVAPAAWLLGAEAAFVALGFEDARRKRRGLDVLAGSPSIVEMHDHVGPEVLAWLYAFDGERPAQVLADLARATGADRADVLQEWKPVRAPRRGLDALDARILRALATEAHRPMGSLARATGLTPKTIRARLRALGREAAFATYPAVSFGRIRGAVAYVLGADVADPRRSLALAEAFPDHVCANLPGSRRAFVYLVAPCAEDIGRALDTAAEVEGIDRVRTDLVRELRSFPEKVLARLEPLADSGRLRRRASPSVRPAGAGAPPRR